MSDYLDYKGLKKLALRGRNHKVGKILTPGFRLWYNKTNQQVHLIERYHDIIVTVTHPIGYTELMIQDQFIDTYIILFIRKFHGIAFKKIVRKPDLTEHNAYYISDFIRSSQGTVEQRYIYKVGATIQNGRIITVDDYNIVEMDKDWKNEYAQISKKNRAALTAFNTMIPFAPVENKGLSALQRRAINREWDPLFNGIDKTVDIVMDTTKEPTAEDTLNIRRLLGIRSAGTDFRTMLQRLVNDARYERAVKDGKTKTITKQNAPTLFNR